MFFWGELLGSEIGHISSRSTDLFFGVFVEGGIHPKKTRFGANTRPASFFLFPKDGWFAHFFLAVWQ